MAMPPAPGDAWRASGEPGGAWRSLPPIDELREAVAWLGHVTHMPASEAWDMEIADMPAQMAAAARALKRAYGRRR